MLGPEVGDDEINACPFDELTDPPGVREQIRFTQTFVGFQPARTTDGNPAMCFDLTIAEQLFEPNRLTGLESSPRDTLLQIHCFDRLQRHWTKQSRR